VCPQRESRDALVRLQPDSRTARLLRFRNGFCGCSSPRQIVNNIADAAQVWHSILSDDNVKMILDLKDHADQIQRIDHKIFDQP
jgi:hypothetical protein